MPEITFILPHWIYWGGIIAIPAGLMWLTRRFPKEDCAPRQTLPVAYLFLVCGGFFGAHRLYLQSWFAAVFIVLFVGVILCNQEARLARNDSSIARNDAFNLQYDLDNAVDDAAADDVISNLETQLATAQQQAEQFAAAQATWHQTSGIIAAVIAALLLLELFLLPRAVRRCPPRPLMESLPPMPSAPRPPVVGGFARGVNAVNGGVGEFVSYWTLIAVFIFYYEVIARYVFNSPTIWAHESMYLIFGMQYMLAGGFCLRENAHVRVDVFYLRMSPRRRALADVCTSAFFFIFAGALTATGWIFFFDAYLIKEVSFTEWAIAYYPIKFALPLGGALIFAQGIVRLMHDLRTLRQGGDEGGAGAEK